MYVPSYFAVTDQGTLHGFMERYSFGVLISRVEGAPFASHLPLLLNRDAGPNGTIVGHMARANPQWRELDGQTVLAVFHGPHAYISPSWYEAENVVPTWNYTAVHATGRAEVLADRDALLDIVARTVSVYEAGKSPPWALDRDSPFVHRLLGQIVGFQIRIDRLEGKWKLNQNHPVERRENVIAALEQQGDP